MGSATRFRQSDAVIWYDSVRKLEMHGTVQYSNLLGSPSGIRELTTVFFPELNSNQKVSAVELRHALPDHSETNQYMHGQVSYSVGDKIIPIDSGSHAHITGFRENGVNAKYIGGGNTWFQFGSFTKVVVLDDDQVDRLRKEADYPGWQASGFQTEKEFNDAKRATAIEAELAQADYRFTDKVEHYNGHPSGVECQEIIRECKDPLIAFAMKHLWRSQWGNKPGAPKVLDLQKTIEYCQLELAREAGEKRL